MKKIKIPKYKKMSLAIYPADTVGIIDKNGSKLKIKNKINKKQNLKLRSVLAWAKNNLGPDLNRNLSDFLKKGLINLNNDIIAIIKQKYIKIGLPGNR